MSCKCFENIALSANLSLKEKLAICKCTCNARFSAEENKRIFILKDAKAEEVENIIMQKLADNPVPWIAAWRDAVCAQVRNSMKVPTYCRENDGLLQELLLTFQRYAELSGSVTMRAFSIQGFDDTKYFE